VGFFSTPVSSICVDGDERISPCLSAMIHGEDLRIHDNRVIVSWNYLLYLRPNAIDRFARKRTCLTSVSKPIQHDSNTRWCCCFSRVSRFRIRETVWIRKREKNERLFINIRKL